MWDAVKSFKRPVKEYAFYLAWAFNKNIQNKIKFLTTGKTAAQLLQHAVFEHFIFYFDLELLAMKSWSIRSSTGKYVSCWQSGNLADRSVRNMSTRPPLLSDRGEDIKDFCGFGNVFCPWQKLPEKLGWLLCSFI